MLAAPAALPSSRWHQHCSDAEWRAYVEKDGGNRQYQLMKLRFRGQFVERWPALASWYGEPLAERVGRLYGEPHDRPSCPVSFRARSYLIYLALRGHTTLDYPWLLASGAARDPRASRASSGSISVPVSWCDDAIATGL